MYFFTSDTHFGNDEILKRENRPFKNGKKFEKTIFKIWNSQVKKDDIIYHLGDYVNYNKNCTNGWQKGLKNIKRCKAKVILIIGNDEQRIIRDFFSNDFDSFKDYCKGLGFYDVKKEDYLNFRGLKVYLNHYPCKHKQNYLNLFGHTHRITGVWKPFGLNVGCDLNHFYLFTEEEIVRLVGQKEIWDKDPDCLSWVDKGSKLK